MISVGMGAPCAAQLERSLASGWRTARGRYIGGAERRTIRPERGAQWTSRSSGRCWCGPTGQTSRPARPSRGRCCSACWSTPTASVAAERLVDDLWEGDPPPSAAATLQGYVSQLRKAVGADRLVTRAGGYELVVGPGELDAHRFDAEVAEARRRLAAGEPDGAVDAI